MACAPSPTPHSGGVGGGGRRVFWRRGGSGEGGGGGGCGVRARGYDALAPLL